MLENIKDIIDESNRVLKEAKDFFGLNLDLDKIIVTVQSAGRKKALGWFWSGKWIEIDGVKERECSEINLSAEHLHSADMGEVLLHELAHAENDFLEIKDCDKTGRIHNKKFKVMAEKVGLNVHDRHPSLGFAITSLGDTAKSFLSQIEFNKDVFKSYRVQKAAVKQGTRLKKLECPDCGYVVRATQQWIDEGLPTCCCGAKFEQIEDET